jgi:hypothetical protein
MSDQMTPEDRMESRVGGQKELGSVEKEKTFTRRPWKGLGEDNDFYLFFFAI